MNATLMAPCWALAPTARSPKTDEAVTRRQRIAEVRALLDEIAVSSPVGDRERSIDLPDELSQPLEAWAVRQAA
jgi:hypothetical protein